MAYEAGTSTAESKSSGMGIGFSSDGAVGVGFSGGKTQTTNMSLLAQRVARPVKLPVMFESLFQACSNVPFLPLLLGMFISPKSYHNFKANQGVEERYARWDRSWICHKCGHTFMRGE
jgi:hypothetical protein